MQSPIGLSLHFLSNRAYIGLDDIIGTLHSVCEATVQYINFSLICALFGASSINTFKEIYILHNICDTWWERNKSRENPGFGKRWAGKGATVVIISRVRIMRVTLFPSL